MSSSNSVQTAVAAARGQLSARSGSPALDAQLLMCHVLGKSRSWLLAHPECLLDSKEITAFEQFICRRAGGEPVAYLLGHQEFWSLKFLVSPATLIPRPATETLVEVILEEAGRGVSICDLGTGSGAVAIAVASERPDLELYATDASLPALLMAAKNNRRLVQGRVHLLAANWLSAFSAGQFDIIVSNPPYIDPADDHLTDLESEPLSALVSGRRGLADLESIIQAAPGHLKTGGLLALEHGFDQQESVLKYFHGRGFSQCRCVKDLDGQPRVSMGIYDG